ncbi:MAG: putative DNA binding domain-containing protein [Chloroflexi bacterium]|nr:putative DNA binding domain-containing protein [Chloroflexota bacterium]
MTDIRQERRLAILANPTETPKIECKTWLDLNENRHKAVIAKAAIALANSDGGTIVFGVSEDNAADGRLTCEPKPAGLPRYTSDAIGSAINKYAEPDIHFNLEFENHPNTGDEHAFVEIAGGIQQPVFAKKSFDGVINKLTCYIRKPGPKSEEPHTAQEWRDLLNRCVRANRDGLLDSIRTIINGRPVDTSPTQSNEQQLREFMAASKARWRERLDEVEEDDIARLRHGYWAFAFSIVGVNPWPTLSDLRRALDEARPAGLRHRLFADTTRSYSSPYPAEGAIEAWTGHPAEDPYRDPYGCSFWRATLGGEFYHLEGFLEDSQPERAEPGTRLYIDISIQLHAMMLKLAARIARSVGEEAEIVICSEWNGVKGRYLRGSQNWWPRLAGDWLCSIEPVTSKPRRLTPQQIDDNWVEVLHDFLHPLYEKFKFYDLKQGWVESAVEKVRSDGW